MTTVFHVRMYSKFIKTEEPQEEETLQENQDSNFLGESFTNRENIKDTIQIRRERQPPAS